MWVGVAVVFPSHGWLCFGLFFWFVLFFGCCFGVKSVVGLFTSMLNNVGWDGMSVGGYVEEYKIFRMKQKRSVGSNAQ